jgi:MFS superfamily sulfate permease-like transporter
MSRSSFHPLQNLQSDIPASIVVFLVAMPLCLGIALASGAPLFSGLIAGMIGGIVVGALSGSSLGVSGPAAGLAVIVLDIITKMGFETLLVVVVLAGIIQVILGFVKGGVIGYYFPSSVIMGMLSGIGIIIFMKQIPHALGYDKDPEGDLSFQQADGENTLSELFNVLDYISPGALIITAVSLAILLVYETRYFKSRRIFQIIPGPLVAVVMGIFLNLMFQGSSIYQLLEDQTVTLPGASSMSEFFGNFTFPDFGGALVNPQVYIQAVVVAVVASLETLLSVEAIDKLDPHKRITPNNRELKAQGVGNILSGLIGGLPVTQVIVRSSANIQSGGVTKASAVIHGFLILLSIIIIPDLLNLIPYATLAAVLMVVGYKLAKPSLFKKMWRQGSGQFVPFIFTVAAVYFTDLLSGLLIGLTAAILYILYNSARIPYKIGKDQGEGRETLRIELAQELTFLNKVSLLRTIKNLPNNTRVIIDGSNTYYMHHDVEEILEDFKISAPERGIELVLIDIHKHKVANPPSHFKLTIEESEPAPTEEVINPYQEFDK